MRVYGRLHVREVVKRMRGEGWVGNPDDRIAAKSIFNVMSSHKDLFRNVGDNFWELTGHEQKRRPDEEAG